ncbi:MAG: protein kinase [Planctomycetota bacterium]
MDIEEILIALRASEEAAIDRAELGRLLEILDAWERADLRVSCAEVLVRDFRVAPAKVRRWEAEIRGRSTRRIGKYELRRRIGQGGMGIVFEATHPNFERPVALKILPPSLGKDPQAVQRFLTEVKSAGRFNHPHIVHAYDAGIDGDIPFLVMEFVSGENLFQFLQRHGPASVEQVRSWLTQALRALAVLEAAGWVHGDVKPSNWILTEDGTLKLADLGLCRPPGPPRADGTVFGSPPYIAPELLRRGSAVDTRCDLYSLGATIYHLMTGRPPYSAQSVAELARAHKQQAARPIREAVPDMPAELAAVIDRLLASDPAERFGSCREVRLALGEPEPAVDDDGMGRPGRGRRGAAESSVDSGRGGRRSWMAHPAAFVVAFLLPMTVAGVYWGTRRDRTHEVTDEAASTAVVPSEAASTAAVGSTDDALGKAWSDRFSTQPRPYAALYAWLGSEAVDHPRRPGWESDLARELEAEALAPWTAVEARIATAIAARSYHDALRACDEFPTRLAVGRFASALEHARESVEQKRREYLGSVQLTLSAALAAGDLVHARQAMRTIDLAAPDRDWLYRELRRLGLDNPWLRGYEADHHDLTERTSAQRTALVAWLRTSEAAMPRIDPVLDPLLYRAAETFAAHPVLRRAKPHEGVWRALFGEGLLARLDPAEVVELHSVLVSAHPPSTTADEPRRQAVAECRAARTRQRAVTACEGWDLLAAEAAWAELLEPPELASTLAVDATAGTIAADRARLRRGAFLRSGAFAASVEVAWSGVASFAYDFADPRALREWRRREAAWRVEGDGVHCRSGDPADALENIVAFEGDLRLAFELPEIVRARPWLVLFGAGESVLGFLASGDGGLSVAAAASPAEVMEALTVDASARWTTVARELEKSRTVDIERTDTGWVVRVGDASVVRAIDDPAGGVVGRAPYRWVSIHSPHVPIRRVVLTGTPAGPWLDARREYWEQVMGPARSER